MFYNLSQLVVVITIPYPSNCDDIVLSNVIRLNIIKAHIEPKAQATEDIVV